MEGIWFRKSTRGSYGVLRGELMECGWRKKYCGGGKLAASMVAMPRRVRRGI